MHHKVHYNNKIKTPNTCVTLQSQTQTFTSSSGRLLILHPLIITLIDPCCHECDDFKAIRWIDDFKSMMSVPMLGLKIIWMYPNRVCMNVGCMIGRIFEQLHEW